MSSCRATPRRGRGARGTTVIPEGSTRTRGSSTDPAALQSRARGAWKTSRCRASRSRPWSPGRSLTVTISRSRTASGDSAPRPAESPTGGRDAATRRLMALAVVLVVGGLLGHPARGRRRGDRAAARRRRVRRRAGWCASWSTAARTAGPGDAPRIAPVSWSSIDDDTVVALDDAGRERWSAPVPGAGLGWPVLGGGVVVVPTLRDDGGPGGCVALDRATGARVVGVRGARRRKVSRSRAPATASCARFGNGVVVAVDRTTGAASWRDVFERGRAALGRLDLRAHCARGRRRDRHRSRSPRASERAGTSRRSGSRHGRGARRLRLQHGRARERTGRRLRPGCWPSACRDRARCARSTCGAGASERASAAPVPDGFDPASIPLVAGGLS